jgi:hypothetical protein
MVICLSFKAPPITFFSLAPTSSRLSIQASLPLYRLTPPATKSRKPTASIASISQSTPFTSHPFCGAVNNIKTVQFESVFDPEISNVHVSGIWSTGFTFILFQIGWCSCYPGERGSRVGYTLVVPGTFLPISHTGGSCWRGLAQLWWSSSYLVFVWMTCS